MFACALALAAAGRGAASDERLLRVVWVREPLVYVATLDSTALVPGDRITLLERRRVRATADVERRLDASLRIATLTSGSLARVQHLDRLTVRVEPAAARAVARLRVGLPTGRASLLFACPPSPAADPPRGYRADTAGRGFVREGAPAAWPETLALVRFDDAADEEIALERNEIDVAVFWPGELSSRMRQDPSRWSVALGARARGVLVARPAPGTGPDPPVDSLALDAMNRQLFRDDLARIPQDGPAGRARYAVDPGLPGAAALQRALDRAAGPSGVPLLRVSYLETPPAATPDGAVPLFAVRCPVAGRASLAPAVRAMGADAIADLAACAPAEREP